MKRPNVFIAGAPKCGTTALSEYLRTHPRVFVCTPKEPFFFATDLPGARVFRTEAEYLALYAAAADRPVCVDASPLYLMSREAIPSIRRFDPAARIIAMFRHPVDLAVSFHAQCRFSQAEDQADLGVAWDLQTARAAGRCLPKACVEPRLLQYRDVASLGAQVERLFAVFPRDQVHGVFLEDLQASPRSVYEGVLAFLGVPYDGRTEFSAVNRRKTSRLMLPGFLRRAVLFARQHWAHTPVYQEVMRRAKKVLEREAATEPLPPELRARLLGSMADDIRLLAWLTGRDLSHWFDSGTSEARQGGCGWRGEIREVP